MSITTIGTWQHLAQLESANLVRTLPEESQGRGRPVKPWVLTGAGHDRFPDSHAQVTADLLGEAALDKLIDHRAERTLMQYNAALSLNRAGDFVVQNSTCSNKFSKGSLRLCGRSTSSLERDAVHIESAQLYRKVPTAVEQSIRPY